MIRLLIVDDSPTESLILKQIFESEGDIEVVACAKNGLEAIQLAEKLRPSVITMDVMMPVVDGIEAIRRIMSTYPVPIVVISSNLSDDSLNASFRALEAGALAVMDKPINVILSSSHAQVKELISTVRAMADIKVIKRRFNIKQAPQIDKKITRLLAKQNFELIAIGASAGGPQALKIILSALPVDFHLPILVVQHMTNGFMRGFVEWLDAETQLKVKCAEDSEALLPGHIYFAPDNYHLEVYRHSSKLLTKLTNKEPDHGFKPSVSVLFKSVAQVSGSHAIAVLLTGMGQDGADGMLEIKKAAGYTIVQDQESAVVFGMPGIALALNAVDRVVPLDQIASYLTNAAKHQK